jgi:NAD(P)-dependent dehydrogenase (short-subunit alcohol dehydrogenase family)
MIFQKELLKDQVAIVTGGGTGIGEVISAELAKHGAHVVITSRDPEHHKEIIKKIEKLGRRAIAVPADIRQPDQVQAVVDRTINEFGKVDILVNNAAGNFVCAMEQLSYNGWKAVIDIVLNGTYLASKAVLPVMKEQGHGNIVNIGATYMWMAAPYVGHSGAAKAGVLNMTRTLAVEWARYGIRVNIVTPGPIEETEGVRRLVDESGMREKVINHIPLNRLGKREEIAWAILYLVSPAAAYTTGNNIVVDGGAWLNAHHYGLGD